MQTEQRRVSAWKELRVLTWQFLLIQLHSRKNLLLSLTFPIVASGITVWIAGENMFVHFEGTKSACFVLVSAAIWGGLFNSIQTVVQERENIKRDYESGLRLRCYTASRAGVQFVLCVVQTALLTSSFIGVRERYGNDLPKQGLILDSPLLEFFVTLMLLTFAADAMGLFVSSMVKKPESANVMAPYILIVQLIFSGVLFPMEGAGKTLSYGMLSRWGMEGLGSISDLNELPLQIQATVPTVPHEADAMFSHSDWHLLGVWLILLGFSALFLVAGNLFLHRIAKDSR